MGLMKEGLGVRPPADCSDSVQTNKQTNKQTGQQIILLMKVKEKKAAKISRWTENEKLPAS